MPQCSVPLCTEPNGHRFPADSKLKKAWVIAIKRVNEDKTLWKPTGCSPVCKKHVTPTDYITKNNNGRCRSLIPHTSLPIYLSPMLICSNVPAINHHHHMSQDLGANAIDLLLQYYYNYYNH